MKARARTPTPPAGSSTRAAVSLRPRPSRSISTSSRRALRGATSRATRITKQMTVLNNATSRPSFTFKLMGVKRVNNANWYNVAPETLGRDRDEDGAAPGAAPMLQHLHRQPRGGLLNWATFPFDGNAGDKMDGVVLLNESLRAATSRTTTSVTPRPTRSVTGLPVARSGWLRRSRRHGRRHGRGQASPRSEVPDGAQQSAPPRRRPDPQPRTTPATPACMSSAPARGPHGPDVDTCRGPDAERDGAHSSGCVPSSRPGRGAHTRPGEKPRRRCAQRDRGIGPDERGRCRRRRWRGRGRHLSRRRSGMDRVRLTGHLMVSRHPQRIAPSARRPSRDRSRCRISRVQNAVTGKPGQPGRSSSRRDVMTPRAASRSGVPGWYPELTPRLVTRRGLR